MRGSHFGLVQQPLARTNDANVMVGERMVRVRIHALGHMTAYAITVRLRTCFTGMVRGGAYTVFRYVTTQAFLVVEGGFVHYRLVGVVATGAGDTTVSLLPASAIHQTISGKAHGRPVPNVFQLHINPVHMTGPTEVDLRNPIKPLWIQGQRFAAFDSGLHGGDMIGAGPMASLTGHPWHNVVQRSFGGDAGGMTDKALASLVGHQAAAHCRIRRLGAMRLVGGPVEPFGPAVIAEVAFVKRALHVCQINLADGPVAERPGNRHLRRLRPLADGELRTLRRVFELVGVRLKIERIPFVCAQDLGIGGPQKRFAHLRLFEGRRNGSMTFRAGFRADVIFVGGQHFRGPPAGLS
jgi:hypothetical protein